MTRAVARFPRQTAWLRRRLDPSVHKGLPLTIAVAVAVTATWTFAVITQDVTAHEGLALLDPRVHAWLLAHRMGLVTWVMRVATWLGSNVVILPLLVIAGAGLGRMRRTWRPVLTIAVVYGCAVILHAVVSELVRRHRPAAMDWLSGASGWSYPSGHTLQATVAYGVLLMLLVPGSSPAARRMLAILAGFVVVLVAVSRVYLAVHWFSDVLGSLTLGVALLSSWQVAHLALKGVQRPPAEGR